MKVAQRTAILILFLAAPLSEGCRRHHRSSKVIVPNPSGTVAGLQPFADYRRSHRTFPSPTCRGTGNTPPDVEGEYDPRASRPPDHSRTRSEYLRS